MKRKLIAVIIIIVSLVTWVYQSTNTEFNKTVKLIEANRKLLRDISITPSNSRDSKYLYLRGLIYTNHFHLNLF